MNKIYNEMLKFLDKNQIYLNEPMSKHTTFKIGGPADIFLKPKNIVELKNIILVANQNNFPYCIIGNGSNLLVKDNGIRGIVIKPDFQDIIFFEGDKVKVGSGVLLSRISNQAYNEGLSGLEFANGIPGSIGGAIKMNAGAYNHEFKDIVLETEYLNENLELCRISNEEHNFQYRCSIFTKNKYNIIISTVLQLKKTCKEEIKKKMDLNNKSRMEKQPIDFPSAGSTFKRGKGYITAALIDKCGLKGYSIGDACVSEKHAGFIINKGKATAKDVLLLIEYVKQKVKDKFNKNIKLEIEILGED